MRGATPADFSIRDIEKVSIHAPHAGRDKTYPHLSIHNSCFNPRAPCGARPRTRICLPSCLGMFQSTRPMRGATSANNGRVQPRGFQSTRPMRGATTPRSNDHGHDTVSIHAPHAGRDPVFRHRRSALHWVSIHAPHAGRDDH